MNKNLTIGFSIMAALATIMLVAVIMSSTSSPDLASDGTNAPQSDTPDQGATAAPEVLVRDNSRYLDEANGAAATMVEFLDFECEACPAQFPVMEQIREDYDGQIDFVIRHFPMPGHANSRPAAAAVEAAAQQGALDGMYKRMFETQIEWGESQEDQSEVFVGFAEDLGLDMDEFVEAMESEENAERIQADFDDGVELGVQGTPTIYVNGQQTSSMPSYEELSSMIDTELTE